MPLHNSQTQRLKSIIDKLKTKKLTPNSSKNFVYELLSYENKDEPISFARSYIKEAGFSAGQRTKLNKLLGGCACQEGGGRKKAKKKVKKVINESGAFKKKFEEITKKVGDLEVLVSQAKGYNQAATNAATKLGTEFSNAKSKMEQKIKDLEATYKKPVEIPQLVKDQITTFKDNVAQYKFEVTTLKTEIVELKKLSMQTLLKSQQLQVKWKNYWTNIKVQMIS